MLLTASVAIAQPSSSLERAVALTKERHYAEARKLLDGVPEPDALNQRIAFHRLRAAIASGLSDTAGAAAEMQRALALAPSDASLLLAAAVAELQAGHPDEALQNVSRAGDSAVARAITGDIQEKRGAFTEAEVAYRGAVEMDPAREDYRAALAYHLVFHQRFRPAVDVLATAIPRFPGSVRLLTLLGIAQYAGGDIEDATATLSRAVQMDPHAEAAHRSLSRIVLESSNAPAGAVVEQLCSWNATVCSALKLRIARENRDPAMLAQAIAGLESAPATDIVARCELARARDWNGQLGEARKEMEQCAAADPSPQNYYRLGRIYQRLGLTSLAQQQMDLRNKILETMSEATASGLGALRTMQ